MQESAAAETLDNDDNESSEPGDQVTDPLAEVANLLGDEPDQDDGEAGDQEADSNTEATGDGQKEPPKNLDELAERLGVEVANLYELEIPIDVGDDVEFKKLGEIKDAFRASDELSVDRLELEETKATQEQTFARALSEIQELMTMLPDAAKSEKLLTAVAQKRQATQQAQTKLLRKVIPAWSDSAVEESDRAEMREHLSEFGFPDNYLDHLYDAKTLQFIRSATKRAARVKAALEQVETVRKAGHKPSGKPSKASKKAGNGNRRRQASEAVSAVSELLSEL